MGGREGRLELPSVMPFRWTQYGSPHDSWSAVVNTRQQLHGKGWAVWKYQPCHPRGASPRGPLSRCVWGGAFHLQHSFAGVRGTRATHSEGGGKAPRVVAHARPTVFRARARRGITAIARLGIRAAARTSGAWWVKCRGIVLTRNHLRYGKYPCGSGGGVWSYQASCPLGVPSLGYLVTHGVLS